ncbi:MAG TPA: acyl-CoA dehydrogenase family protein [Trebonia sp.]
MTDSLLVDTVDSIFATVCTDEALRAAEHAGFAPAAWDAVAEAGLPWISLPEGLGGEGGDLADALAVLRVAGYHGLPLPLAETGLLAGWLRTASGLHVDRVPATVAVGPDLSWREGRVHGTARLVAWGRSAEQVVALVPAASPDDAPVVAVFDAAGLRIERHVNLAGEPRDTLYFAGAAPVASAPAGPGVSAETLRRRGALTRIVLMAGAASRIADITAAYTGERQQFGRPIGRFPGVQEHVVHIAQQAATLGMAADLAVAAAAADPALAGPQAAFQVPAAKVIADDAATIATAAAHQAHGAMGMTREYSLHHVTRRMWAWTREYGTGPQSADEVGEIVAKAGADGLWPLIASGGAAR